MTTTLYLKSGSRYDVTTDASMDLHETLPAATFTVQFDTSQGRFYLDQIEDFEIKGKLYGDTPKNAVRILNTFQERPASTGVLLSGEKGSGKTLLAKLLSLQGKADGIPTIVINQPWHGDQFNTFMQMIEQPLIVIFDEFEKVYDHDKQEKVLTLLDGVYASKTLFVVTCNDKWRINEAMRNRPGRLFYHLAYKGLERDFIREYCEDNLKDTSYIDTICRIAVVFAEFNFDMLKAMVEEMNRYDESPQEAMKLLNTKPEHGERASYTVTLKIGGLLVSESAMDSTTWFGNPLSQDLQISYKTLVGQPDNSTDPDDEPGWSTASFSPTQLDKIDGDTGVFHWTNKVGEELSLVKVKAPTYNYSAF